MVHLAKSMADFVLHQWVQVYEHCIGQTVCTQCIVFSDIFMQCNERVWCLEMFTVTTISLLIGWSLVKYMKVSADKTKPKHMSEGFQHHSRGRVKKKKKTTIAQRGLEKLKPTSHSSRSRTRWKGLTNRIHLNNW